MHDGNPPLPSLAVFDRTVPDGARPTSWLFAAQRRNLEASVPPVPLLTVPPEPAASPLEIFVACAHQMLDPTTPESVRLAMEPRLLAQLPTLRALGVFELFELRDPALRAWLADELAARHWRTGSTPVH